MNFRMMGRVNAYVLAIEAVLMMPSALVSVIYRERVAAVSIFVSALLTLAAAGILYFITRGARKGMQARDGMVCVGFSWILMSTMGCLPFFLSREIPNFIDALFETVSGFTTTGASILTDVEAMSHGLIFWRSFTHWIGGMGVLVFMLAIVPLSGKNTGFTLHLMRAESPGPDVGKITPRMKDSARSLYLMYIFLTILCFIFLLAGKMPVFGAFCTAFGIAGTGGFGIKADSMLGYSDYLQTVSAVFMLLFGINFTCYYLLAVKREWKAVLKDEELRLYLIFIGGATALITWNITSAAIPARKALHHAFFTVVSIITTSGFATLDFNKWPTFSKVILLFLMFSGACAGSTGGGIKVSRILILFKQLRRSIHQILNPQKIQVVKVNRRTVSETVVTNTSSYLIAYVFIVIVSFLLVSLNPDFSVESNFSAVMCTFNNIGPGLDQVGPTSNFYAYDAFSKIVLTFDMLLGRLEIFPILVLFSRKTWNNAVRHFPEA